MSGNPRQVLTSFRCALALLMVAGLTACYSPTRHTLSLSAARPATEPSSRIERRIGWYPLVDERPNASAAIGQISLDTYAATSVDSWIEESLRGLARGSFKISPGESPSAELCIRPKLIRLYLQNVDITKSAHVVLQLEYFWPGKEPVTKLYRGRYTAINWWGTDEEMSEALQRALHDCLRQVAADLVREPTAT